MKSRPCAIGMWLVLSLLASLWAGSTVSAEENEYGDEWGFTSISPPDETTPDSTIAVAGICKFEGEPADSASVSFYRIADEPGEEDYWEFESFPVGPNGQWSGTISVSPEAPIDDYRLDTTCYAGDQAYGMDPRTYRVTTAPTTPQSSASDNR